MVKITIATKDGGITRDATAEEQAEIDAQIVKDNKERKDNYLNEIKLLRLQRLQETDYMANSDYTMPENIKTWRQYLFAKNLECFFIMTEKHAGALKRSFQ